MVTSDQANSVPGYRAIGAKGYDQPNKLDICLAMGLPWLNGLWLEATERLKNERNEYK